MKRTLTNQLGLVLAVVFATPAFASDIKLSDAQVAAYLEEVGSNSVGDLHDLYVAYRDASPEKKVAAAKIYTASLQSRGMLQNDGHVLSIPDDAPAVARIAARSVTGADSISPAAAHDSQLRTASVGAPHDHSAYPPKPSDIDKLEKAARNSHDSSVEQAYREYMSAKNSPAATDKLNSLKAAVDKENQPVTALASGSRAGVQAREQLEEKQRQEAANQAAPDEAKKFRCINGGFMLQGAECKGVSKFKDAKLAMQQTKIKAPSMLKSSVVDLNNSACGTKKATNGKTVRTTDTEMCNVTEFGLQASGAPFCGRPGPNHTNYCHSVANATTLVKSKFLAKGQKNVTVADVSRAWARKIRAENPQVAKTQDAALANICRPQEEELGTTHWTNDHITSGNQWKDILSTCRAMKKQQAALGVDPNGNNIQVADVPLPVPKPNIEAAPSTQ